MKVILAIFTVLAVAQAATIDWDNLQRLDVDPLFPLLRKGNGRVVGGVEASPHQFPYQAALFATLSNGKVAFCGGSLISTTKVLTAAHCVDGMISIDVVLGAHYIREEEPTQVRLTSTNFIVHSKWSPLLLGNDIAIITLPQAVELNENIRLITLPSRSDEVFLEETATVSGWGKDSDSATGVSPVLRYTSNNVISNLKCSLSFPLIIRNSHICVSGNGGKSACNGDSGGPLTVTIDGVLKQIGLVSFGNGLGCERGSPAVYTRLTSFLDWIAENA